MPLHRQAELFLRALALQPPVRLEADSIPEMRRAALRETAGTGYVPALRSVKRHNIPSPGGELPLCVYTPFGASAGTTLYFHGGGWVLGSLESHDELVRRLAVTTGCTFVSVGYRLAPEHKFPAALEDAWEALCWVAASAAAGWNGDPACIAVAGDSAGANLAAALSLLTRDRRGPALVAQALAYPVLDRDFDRPSYHRNAEGYFLTRRQMMWFWEQYLPAAHDEADPYAAPLRAPSLAGLPRALILTAEYDPLVDEGRAYAEALRRDGVEVHEHEYPGMVHGFLRRFEQFDDGWDAIRRIGGFLKQMFPPGP